MELNDPLGVYQDVAASLTDVSRRLSRQASRLRKLRAAGYEFRVQSSTFHGLRVSRRDTSYSCQFFQISPPRGWSPYVPKAGFKHTVGLVDLPVRIDQKRPPEAGVLDVCPGKKPGFEGHYDDFYVPPVELTFTLMQLHQVASTGQSTQMPVENHKEPETEVVVKAVDFSSGIGKSEGDGRTPYQTVHNLPHTSKEGMKSGQRNFENFDQSAMYQMPTSFAPTRLRTVR
jgi:hypothetical protein